MTQLGGTLWTRQGLGLASQPPAAGCQSLTLEVGLTCRRTQREQGQTSGQVRNKEQRAPNPVSKAISPTVNVDGHLQLRAHRLDPTGQTDGVH